MTKPTLEDFEHYTEQVCDCFTDHFYDLHEEWIRTPQCLGFITECFEKKHKPNMSARIIERIYHTQNQ